MVVRHEQCTTSVSTLPICLLPPSTISRHPRACKHAATSKASSQARARRQDASPSPIPHPTGRRPHFSFLLKPPFSSRSIANFSTRTQFISQPAPPPLSILLKPSSATSNHRSCPSTVVSLGDVHSATTTTPTMARPLR